MERDYEPRGWLGMILGAKLFFEFSGKYPFDQKAQELLKEINSHLQNIPEVTSSENVMTTENDGSRKPMTCNGCYDNIWMIELIMHRQEFLYMCVFPYVYSEIAETVGV